MSVMGMFTESAYYIFFSQMKAISKNRKKASLENKIAQREKTGDNQRRVINREKTEKYG